MSPGDLVIVASGPHMLRHGVICDGMPSELTASGLTPAPAGFAYVNFYSSASTLLKQQGKDGTPAHDLVRCERLRVAVGAEHVLAIEDLLDSNLRGKREHADAALRAALLA